MLLEVVRDGAPEWEGRNEVKNRCAGFWEKPDDLETWDLDIPPIS